MKTVVIAAATFGTSLPMTVFGAAGYAAAAAGRRLRRAVSCRREALEHRLQEFVLELLAAIVLIALFMVVTAPETRKDSDVRDPGPKWRRSTLGREACPDGVGFAAHTQAWMKA